jgi:hypothetical protein
MQATHIDNNTEKSSILFGKKDIESLITNRIEESAILDYKASASISTEQKKKDEITKDVSAFANSNGGRIIYGVAEYKEREKRNLPEKMDPIDQRNFSKEWLEHIIAQIKPRIEGIRIHPVHIGPCDWDYCYVVDIPQSNTAHQANDFRYYKRRNFESTPMEDYEVRDVMNQKRHPKISAEIRVFTQPYRIVGGKFIDNTAKIVLRIKNDSPVLARSFLALVDFPLKTTKYHCLIKNATINIDEGYWRVSFHNGNEMLPLFPNATRIFNEEITPCQEIQPPPQKMAQEIKITLYADEMEKIELVKNLAKAEEDWV